MPTVLGKSCHLFTYVDSVELWYWSSSHEIVCGGTVAFVALYSHEVCSGILCGSEYTKPSFPMQTSRQKISHSSEQLLSQFQHEACTDKSKDMGMGKISEMWKIPRAKNIKPQLLNWKGWKQWWYPLGFFSVFILMLEIMLPPPQRFLHLYVFIFRGSLNANFSVDNIL